MTLSSVAKLIISTVKNMQDQRTKQILHMVARFVIDLKEVMWVQLLGERENLFVPTILVLIVGMIIFYLMR